MATASMGCTIPTKGHHFDAEKILLDPKAREIGGRDVWKQPSKPPEIFPYRGRIPFYQFDWGHTRPLKRPESEMVIYEMHVRGFTAHPSSRGEASRARSKACAIRLAISRISASTVSS